MKALLIACLFATGMATPVLAANARHPYQNVDRRVDAGNPTGDNEVDRLNQQQLDSARNAMGGPGQQMPMPMQGQGQGQGWQR